jgi:hypothetical protein
MSFLQRLYGNNTSGIDVTEVGVVNTWNDSLQMVE